MSEARWGQVDDYLEAAYALSDPALEAAQAAARAAGLPEIQVQPNLGRLLQILAQSVGARRILELGTLGGYSTIWLARALPADGRLVTLELKPEHAAVARANLAHAGLAERVEIRVGSAADSLAALAAAGGPPFDFVFIDADKAALADYFAAALPLTRPGGLILVDNVVRDGAVTDAASPDANVQGVRRFNAAVAAEPRVSATVLQTVGRKGWDGIAVVWVKG